MGRVIQFPSKMVFGLYGLSYDALKKGCDANVYSQPSTMRYSRITDSPGLRSMLGGDFVIPKMTADGLEFLMKDHELDTLSSITLAQAFTAAMEAGNPHLLTFKIGGHHLNEVTYKRDCTPDQEVVMPYTAMSSDAYYLKPGKVRIFKAYRLNTHHTTSKYPAFSLVDVTLDFA